MSSEFLGKKTIEFVDVDKMLEGIYTCVARNEFGIDQHDFEVSVEDTTAPFSMGLTEKIAIGFSGLAGIVLILLSLAYWKRFKTYKVRQVKKKCIL
jgi:hypothetical protein